MTTTALPGIARPETSRPLLPDVVRSEWIKFRTVRSTYWTLFVTVVGMIGLGALFAFAFVSRYDRLNPIERLTFNATTHSLRGFFMAQLAVGVLGVLIVTSEYSTGSIRATLAAVPQRRTVLIAKSLVFTAVMAVLGIASSFGAFFVGQAILSQKGLEAHLSDPGALRSVIGAGLYLTVVGLLSVGLGTMIRRTAGAIATVVGLLLILPGIVAALPSSWQNVINPYLPSVAGSAIMGSAFGDGRVLSPWAGFGVFCAYAAAALVAGAVLLKRRDA
ncbi:MAG TPA: ABC transporter permease subunit [Acidimicrobiales bacterium]|nr:ABC transporter permease subunit [Acidimicrobiales bacterium]